MPDQNQTRRHRKVLGFVIAETVAIAILLLAGTFAFSVRPVNSAVITALNVVIFAAAGGVATIPILFFCDRADPSPAQALTL